MSQTRLHSRREGAVLVLTLDGPETRNAIGPDFYLTLQAALIEAPRDGARAVVLTGAGGFFCSGGNINALKDSASGTMAEATARTDRLNALIRAIRDCPVPVVAAVEGGAAGAGLSLALACDLIVAAEGAKFVAAYVKVGLTPDGGATWFLRAALPQPLVMEMCLLGTPVTAERLAGAGLVTLLATPGEAEAQALAMATRIAEGPREATQRIKRLVIDAARNDLATHLLIEADGINTARFGPEAAEGIAAFQQKRKPVFDRS